MCLFGLRGSRGQKTPLNSVSYVGFIALKQILCVPRPKTESSTTKRVKTSSSPMTWQQMGELQAGAPGPAPP